MSAARPGNGDDGTHTFVLRLQVSIEGGDERAVDAVRLETDEGACV